MAAMRDADGAPPRGAVYKATLKNNLALYTVNTVLKQGICKAYMASARLRHQSAMAARRSFIAGAGLSAAARS